MSAFLTGGMLPKIFGIVVALVGAAIPFLPPTWQANLLALMGLVTGGGLAAAKQANVSNSPKPGVAGIVEEGTTADTAMPTRTIK